jgi:hypothetical protein
MHSPNYANAMITSEVMAASIRKKRGNSRLPAMRDTIYDVESPWFAVQYCRALIFDHQCHVVFVDNKTASKQP